MAQRRPFVERIVSSPPTSRRGSQEVIVPSSPVAITTAVTVVVGSIDTTPQQD